MNYSSGTPTSSTTNTNTAVHGKREMSSKQVKLEWEAFVAGLGAGAANIVITYPMHKLMFRQMLYGVPTLHAFDQLRKEGFRLLYRGVLPPLCQKTVSTSLMFGSYKAYGESLISIFPEINHQLARSIGAGLAGINEAILTPFERVQTLLQDKHYNTKFQNSYHAVQHIWKHHGFTEFYRGFSVVVFRNSFSNIIFFATKEKIQSILPPSNNTVTKWTTDFISGGFLGAALSTIYYPLNVIKSRMQCRLGGPLESPKAIFHTVLKERGNLSAMYRGVHLNYTRALISWGIINSTYEQIIKVLYKMEGRDS